MGDADILFIHADDVTEGLRFIELQDNIVLQRSSFKPHKAGSSGWDTYVFKRTKLTFRSVVIMLRLICIPLHRISTHYVCFCAGSTRGADTGLKHNESEQDFVLRIAAISEARQRSVPLVGSMPKVSHKNDCKFKCRVCCVKSNNQW